jgi:hypothetical protein
MKKPRDFKQRDAHFQVFDRRSYHADGKKYWISPEVWVVNGCYDMKLKTLKKFQKWINEAVKYLEKLEQQKRETK